MLQDCFSGHLEIKGAISTIVAAWLTKYCILFIHAFAKLADIEFVQEKVPRLVEQQVGYVTDGEIVCREY